MAGTIAAKPSVVGPNRRAMPFTSSLEMPLETA